jgi:hypothetical protein
MASRNARRERGRISISHSRDKEDFVIFNDFLHTGVLSSKKMLIPSRFYPPLSCG